MTFSGSEDHLLTPSLPYCVQVVMDKAAALRESLKPLAEAQGLKLTYLPIMLKVRRHCCLHS